MGKILLGVVLTLAVLYPAATKGVLGSAVDTAHSIAMGVLEKAK